MQVASGTHFVGQGFELQVGVVGATQRPQVDRPSINDADVWLIENDVKPISASGIGGMVAESNLFLVRFRVVPRRPGTLEIPSIRARLRDRSGRSRPVRVSIRPVPVEGRPAAFLGGVGRFALKAEAAPGVVRVGQELDFRITVTGRAAWGMIDRPELKRFDRLRIGLRIEPEVRRSDHRAAVADIRLPAPAHSPRGGGAAAGVDRGVRSVVVAICHPGHSGGADPRRRGPRLRSVRRSTRASRPADQFRRRGWSGRPRSHRRSCCSG